MRWIRKQLDLDEFVEKLLPQCLLSQSETTKVGQDRQVILQMIEGIQRAVKVFIFNELRLSPPGPEISEL
jgi:hypothetical protein